MIRLTRAKELLLETDLSVDAVAHRSGFQHAEYMSATFRKAFGEPPGRFRRRKTSATTSTKQPPS
jgi:LacI family transcriptional regulator